MAGRFFTAEPPWGKNQVNENYSKGTSELCSPQNFPGRSTGVGCHFLTSLVAQKVKHLPTMRETWVQSLDQEDLLEKEMATHSSILAWRIPWMEEPDRLQSMGLRRVGHY